jgi:hypothetical protein
VDRFFFILKKLFPSGDALPEDFRNYINQIYLNLFPFYTNCVDKWRDTFGLIQASSDENMRVDIDTAWKAQGGQGADYIQSILNNAGFNVQVHENNPPIDPDILLTSIPWMVAGGQFAYAGNDEAVAGRTGGDLLVNGDIITEVPLYLSFAGASYMVAGNDLAVAGQFDEFEVIQKIYQIPNDPDLWGAFFFIGGDVTRNPVTHEITAIENADIPSDRKSEFLRQILKLKPAQTWAGLFVSYT